MSSINNEKLEKKVWVYDLEQLKNCHTNTFTDKDSDQTVVFEISERRNDVVEYIHFLQNYCKALIGFNCLNYDYPLLHFILTEIRLRERDFNNPAQLNYLLSRESDRRISMQFSSLPEWEILIPQLDLFRIHHFDNAARRTSLKHLQFALRWKTVSDYEFGDGIIKEEDIDKLIEYNFNDVASTKLLYNLSKEDIELRKNINKQFNLNCRNYSDVKIGSELFLQFIAKKLNILPKELNKLRTERDFIKPKDIILPYISFKTKTFKDVLSKFLSETIIPGERKPFEIKTLYDGVEYIYGVGGLHACNKSGVYESDSKYYIEDIDVSSFYPALAVLNEFNPEHLGSAFVDAYRERYLYRLGLKSKPKNELTKEEKIAISVWKLALNGTYGKSSDRYSFLYDPKFTFSITINGQLLLTMLLERILLSLEGSELLQANTDGITLKLKREDRDKLLLICKKWEKLTGLELEFASYRKMIIRDVNNYMAMYDEPEENLRPQFPKSNYYDNEYTKHKTKGAFQVVPEQNGKIALNKNWSKRVVPKAIYNYYIKGIPIKESIMNNKDIYDFCIRARGTSDWYPQFNKPDGTSEKLTKTVRYYASLNGGKLMKVFTSGKKKGSIDNIEANARVNIFNDYVEKPFYEYNIDYNYYIRECNKIINSIENNGQIEMF